MEDVIQPPVLSGLFDDQDIVGLFYHADHRMITPGIGTEFTDVGLGEIPARTTIFYFFLDSSYGVRQGQHPLGRRPEQMKCEPLGCFFTDSGQASEFIDQYCDCLGAEMCHNG